MTAGRILDHLGNKRMDLSHVSVLVMDEADEMLSLGFWPDMLDKHDMVWGSLPDSWDEAPFLGNGEQGTLMYKLDNQTLRWDVGCSAAHDHRSVDVKGRRIVPNDFTVLLSPSDHAGFADIEDALRTELVEAVREYAREEGYHFMGPVAVELRVDNSLRSGHFGIASQLKQPEPGKRPGTIVMPSGDRIELSDDRHLIGRLPDCTVIIADTNTSRHHAQITRIRVARPRELQKLCRIAGRHLEDLVRCEPFQHPLHLFHFLADADAGADVVVAGVVDQAQTKVAFELFDQVRAMTWRLLLAVS